MTLEEEVVYVIVSSCLEGARFARRREKGAFEFVSLLQMTDSRFSTDEIDVLGRFWRAQLCDDVEISIRERAIEHSHVIAKQIGADAALEVIESTLLPHESSDDALEKLAYSLGHKEYSFSKRAWCFLTWLLENPNPKIRNTATKSVLQHAQRGSELLTFPGLIDLNRFDAAPVEQAAVAERNDNAGQQVLLAVWLMDASRFKSFYQRVALCEILAAPVSSGLDAEQEKELIQLLAKDRVPEVRLALAKNLGNATRADKEQKRVLSLEIMQDLMGDSDDLVRAVAIENCLLNYLELVDKSLAIHFVSEQIVHSQSWRARLSLAKQLPQVMEKCCKHLGDDQILDSMDIDHANKKLENNSSDDGINGTAPSLPHVLNMLLELCTDPEPDVRAETARHLHLLVSQKDLVLEIVERLVNDEDTEVRKAVIEAFPKLVQSHPPKVAELLVNIVHTDNEPEIRTSATQVLLLDQILAALPEENRLLVIQSVYNAVNGASSGVDRSPFMSWRTTSSAVCAIPRTIKHFPSQTWATKADGLSFYKRALSDQVYNVRQAAIEQLPALVESFGLDWAKGSIAPIAIELFGYKSDYKIRLTALELLHSLHKAQCLTDAGHAVVLAAAKDPVPNVRDKAESLFAKPSM